MLRIHTRAYTLTCTHTVGVVDEGSPPQTASPSHNPRLPLEVYLIPTAPGPLPCQYTARRDDGARTASSATSLVWPLSPSATSNPRGCGCSHDNPYSPHYTSVGAHETPLDSPPACFRNTFVSKDRYASRSRQISEPLVFPRTTHRSFGGPAFFFCSCDTRGLWPHHR